MIRAQLSRKEEAGSLTEFAGRHSHDQVETARVVVGRRRASANSSGLGVCGRSAGMEQRRRGTPTSFCRFHDPATAGEIVCGLVELICRRDSHRAGRGRGARSSYLPRPDSAALPPTPTATPPSKRSARWEGRATPSTPSKRPRMSEPAQERQTHPRG